MSSVRYPDLSSTERDRPPPAYSEDPPPPYNPEWATGSASQSNGGASARTSNNAPRDQRSRSSRARGDGADSTDSGTGGGASGGGTPEVSFVYFHQILKLLEESPELKQTVAGIAKQIGAAVVGGGAGGAVGGPLGCFLGLMAGSAVGYSLSDNYQSLITILRNMNDTEKCRLERRVQELVGAGSLEALGDWVAREANRVILLETVAQHAQKT